ncbi:MAG: PEGA domain-containing protein [Gammaproteobacteria bacterium]|nr:PEGA domain-containing protein [Gammaproteobacteria bacterium]
MDLKGDNLGLGAAAGRDEIVRPVNFEPHRQHKAGARIAIAPRTWLIAVPFAVVALIAWFMFAARAVYIEVSPEDSDVGIDGVLKLRLGDRFLLLPGEYALVLSAEGYRPLTEALPIGDAPDQHFTYELQRLPGHLAVDTGPVMGAEVFVDGKSRGKTPVTIRDLAHGRHQVRITADRYAPHEESVEMEGLDKSQSLKVTLAPAWADVTLKSEPAGAEVLVDDQPAGVTPVTAPIIEGTHSVRVRSPGYKDWQKELRVAAGEPQSLEDIRLELAEAVVFLSSEPSAASVTVDGEYRGLTPLELALTPGRTSTVRLFKQGYKGAVREISAKPRDSLRVAVPMQPELATVEVTVEPADASIFVDGVLKGIGRQMLQLPARKHQIAARKDGYVDYQIAVTPHTDFTQQVKIKLQSQQQARQAAIKSAIRTAQGQELKLFRPGTFTLGASRREPGRRANETLLTVRLTRPFYLGLKEVSNAEFRKFSSAHTSGRVQGQNLDGEKHPVVMVTWEQAARYCNWLSQAESLKPFYRAEGEQVVGFDASANGYRLPTEAEWEWAARVAEGSAPLKFPWGAEMPPPAKSGNYADETAAGIIGKVVNKYDDGFVVTAPTGSFPAGRSGLFDMGGNAAEWVHDFYGIYSGSADTAIADPLGPERGEFHVIRGSSWAHGGVSELRLSYRDYGKQARQDVGFRIARFLD